MVITTNKGTVVFETGSKFQIYFLKGHHEFFDNQNISFDPPRTLYFDVYGKLFMASDGRFPHRHPDKLSLSIYFHRSASEHTEIYQDQTLIYGTTNLNDRLIVRWKTVEEEWQQCYNPIWKLNDSISPKSTLLLESSSPFIGWQSLIRHIRGIQPLKVRPKSLEIRLRFMSAFKAPLEACSMNIPLDCSFISLIILASQGNIRPALPF